MKRVHVRGITGPVVAVLLLVLGTMATGAQTLTCAPRAEIASFLKDKFQELQDAYGLVGDKAVLELYISDGGATWTLVLTDISGRSCILAAGDNWEERPDVAELRT